MEHQAGKFDAELEIIDAYQKANNLPGLLDTLEHMKNAKLCMRLPQEQEKAYDVVSMGLREIFFSSGHKEQ